jgi:hypothetical protein
VCLGQFLHQYLAGTRIGYPGFQSTARGNALARKIVASDIELGLNGSFSFYTADNCTLAHRWYILYLNAFIRGFLEWDPDARGLQLHDA